MCCSGLQQPQKQSGRIAFACESRRQTRDLWVRFVRIKRENFFPQPQAKFLICSVHFEENSFTRAFDLTQLWQLKPGSLHGIQGRKDPSKERDSTGRKKGIQRDKEIKGFNETNCQLPTGELIFFLIDHKELSLLQSAFQSRHLCPPEYHRAPQ